MGGTTPPVVIGNQCQQRNSISMCETGPGSAPFCIPPPLGVRRKSACAQNLPDHEVRPAPSVASRRDGASHGSRGTSGATGHRPLPRTRDQAQLW